ncbi:PREDICTED: uncharacterized protein LOC106749247 isoform X6 [Dinoponera quadriceps]|uniref:Uncharacterized protein LOC106749247 isoform X6 n=1 Tax=Dinoponera quadriceps TaxID=609295 RepID=A0A6P3XZP5_DINQU|nr:PREDICTED: uncharacterized protein LOC106749247 isoform X6 [Dinoponera quadriceps]
MIDYFVCYVFPALSHIFCVAVVLTKVEEVLENWQDKLQHNAASRPSETVGPTVSTLRILNTEQQQCIELEREQTKKAEIKLKDMVSWLTEREAHHKMYLGCLEKENEDLRYTLTDMQRKRDQDELANNIKASKFEMSKPSKHRSANQKPAVAVGFTAAIRGLAKLREFRRGTRGVPVENSR